MNVLLVTYGTAGDVHPFVGIGRALKARGHSVTLLANEHFITMAERSGLGFAAVGRKEEYDALLRNPRIWRGVAGALELGRQMVAAMPAQFNAIAERSPTGQTVIVASGAAFGARIAHEVLGCPLVTVALQPALFASLHRMPVVAGAPRIPTSTPRVFKRLIKGVVYFLADRFFHVARINEFRARLGLGPIREPVADWWFSPQRVIGLFPDWFGDPQPDWPTTVRLTGFPLYDEREHEPTLAPELERFLASGEPPIVFTPGTGMMHAKRFFATAVRVCGLLKRRGLLLTRFREHVPPSLPSSIQHVEYVPFSVLLPRAAAIVHHGGVGTCAQALAAGLAQVVMPMAYDQPDNADRLKRLGVAEVVSPGAFRPASVARRLQRLLKEPRVMERCADLARRLSGADALTPTCELIERLAPTAAAHPGS